MAKQTQTNISMSNNWTENKPTNKAANSQISRGYLSREVIKPGAGKNLKGITVKKQKFSAISGHERRMDVHMPAQLCGSTYQNNSSTKLSKLIYFQSN